MLARAAVRFRFEVPPRTTLFLQDRGEHDADLTDVSLTGCGFETDDLEQVGIGARVEFRMPGGQRRSGWGRIRYISTVARERGKVRIGVQFDQPLGARGDDAEDSCWQELQRTLALRDEELGRARRLASRPPDVREALVAEVASQIREGRYHVTGADVAAKMIQEHLGESRFALH